MIELILKDARHSAKHRGAHAHLKLSNFFLAYLNIPGSQIEQPFPHAEKIGI